MGDIIYIIIQGCLTLIAFFAGAWVYHRGETRTAPVPSLDLNKQEQEPTHDWDQV